MAGKLVARSGKHVSSNSPAGSGNLAHSDLAVQDIDELAQRERERIENERLAKEAKLAALGLTSGGSAASAASDERSVVAPPKPAGSIPSASAPRPTPAYKATPPTPTRTPATANDKPSPTPPAKLAKPLPTPTHNPAPAPPRPSKSAPKPPPKSASSAALQAPTPSVTSGSASAPSSPALTRSATQGSRVSQVKSSATLERKDSSRSSSSGGLVSSLGNAFTTIKAKASEALNDVTTTVRELAPFGSSTDEPAPGSEPARPTMIISSPVRTTHVGHLGYDATTQRFEARNLPPEWQAMFTNLNKTLNELGAEGITPQEANFLLSKIEIAPPKPLPPAPSPRPSMTARSASGSATPRPPEEAPPRPPSQLPPSVPQSTSHAMTSQPPPKPTTPPTRALLELEDLRDEARKLRERVRTLEAETRALRGAEAELRQLRIELNDTRSRLDRAQQRVTELERREKMSEFTPASRQSLAPGQGMREVYAKELQALQQRSDAERETLRSQITKEASRRAACESELESLKAELRSLRADQSELLSLRTARESLQRDYERVQAERDTLEAEMQRLRASTTTSQDNEAGAQLKRLQEDLARQAARTRTLETEGSELRAKLAQSIPRSEAEAIQQDLRAKLEHSNKELATLQEQLQQEQNQVNTLRAEVRQKELTIAELREMNEALKQQQPAASEVPSDDVQIQELESSISQLSQRLRLEAEDWSTRLEALRAEKSSVESELSDTKAQLAAARTSLDAERRDFEAQLAASAKEISSLKAQLALASSAAQPLPLASPMSLGSPPPPPPPSGAPPPPPPPSGAPPPPPPPPGPSLIPRPSSRPAQGTGETSAGASNSTAEAKPEGGLNAALLESIRNPGIKLKKVNLEEKISVEKVDDQSMLAILAKALIDRRAHMKEDHTAGQDEGWDDD